MIKHWKLLSTAVFATALLTWGMSTSLVHATPATVGMDQGCLVLDEFGSLILASSDQSVVTYGKNGSVKLTCKLFKVTNTSGGPITWNFGNTGILCNTPGGLTTKWVETISYVDGVGNINFQCKLP